MEAGATPEQFWEWDFYEALVFIRGYQSRIDDAIEVQALFTSALINYERKKSKQIKPTDLFDRKKLEEKRKPLPSPEEARGKERRVLEVAAHLPVPARIARRSGPVPPPS